MSFEDYSSNDLLASITSAFDLASSSSPAEKAPEDESTTNQDNQPKKQVRKSCSTKDTMSEENCLDFSGHHRDLPSFGEVYTSSNSPYVCYPPDSVQNNTHSRQSSSQRYDYCPDVSKYHQMTLVSPLAEGACFSSQDVTAVDCFPVSSSTPASSTNVNSFWTSDNVIYNASQGSSSSRRRTSSSSRSSKRSESKQLEELKLRYNRTLCFLKECNLYDITMKAADMMRRNSHLQMEIDQLRNDIACYFSGYA